MIRGKIVYAVVATVSLLIISGCVSAPPKASPMPTSTQLPTGTPAPIVVTPSPTAPQPVAPTIRVTFYNTSVNGEENFTVRWQVSGGMLGDISHSAVHWGYSSVKISNYTRESNVETGKTPHIFSAGLKAPAGGDYIYFMVHAIVDGAELYSNEYQIAINPRYTGGGGGY